MAGQPSADAGGPEVDGAGIADIEKGAAERLAFFSDAVVAIALTLLALELPVPSGDTSSAFFRSLQDNSFDYVSFLISFVVIGTHWQIHHRVFRWLIAVNRPMVQVNLGWLLLIVLTPFLTKVLREGELNAAKFGLYAGVQALLILLFAVLELIAIRGGLFDPRTPESVTRRARQRSWGSALGFVLSIPLYLVIGKWAFVLWVVVPRLWDPLVVERRLPGRRDIRLRATRM